MSAPRPFPDANSITALMAIVTAVIALGIGVWENTQMREHNRLSVTPHLVLTVEFRTEEGRAVDQGIIRVANEGVGPAVIDQVDIVVTNAEGAEQQFSSWGEAEGALEALLGATLARRVELGPEVMLGVDRTYEVATFERPAEDENALFPTLLTALDLRLRYHSVYGEPFEANIARVRSQILGAQSGGDAL